MNLDREFAVGRLGLLLAAMGLAIWGVRARNAQSDSHARMRRIAIVLLGLLAYGSYYYFFRLHHRGGIEPEDAFHYYVGSKYFSELGYYGIYEATFLALVEDGSVDPTEVERVRDLRNLKIYPAPRMLRLAPRWKREFTPDRWEAFKEDVGWFRDRMEREHFAHLMIDHGYHPSPVWTWIGGQFTSAVPLGSSWLLPLVRSDRLLVFASFVAVAWAFGLETAGMVAIIWGSGFLWRYGWVGDSILRQLWLVSLILGLCMLRRGRDGLGGAALTLSSLLRVFPGIFVAGYAASALRDAWRERALPPRAIHFGVGCAISGVLLFGASLTIAPKTFEIYPSFVEKIGTFATQPALNKVGLPVILAAVESRAPKAPASGNEAPRTATWAKVALRGVQLAIAIAVLWLFWRAIAHCQRWEAAALSFSLIPVLTQPTNYYFSFSLAAALLASRRPRIAVWLIAACALWTVVGLILYREQVSYVWASWIALGLSVCVLLEMGRPLPQVETWKET